VGSPPKEVASMGVPGGVERALGAAWTDAKRRSVVCNRVNGSQGGYYLVIE